MVSVNGVEVIDRHNRPAVNQKVLLRAFFINDGRYQDPYDISGVTVFSTSGNQNPSSLLNLDNTINTSSVSSLVLMSFGASANDSGAALAESSYNVADASSASGIFRLSEGEYAVILDGSQTTSGMHSINTPVGIEVENAAVYVGDYIDIWTVKLSADSDYTSLINEFSLKDDTFFTITEPLLFDSKVRMTNKRITLGSKVDLKAFIDVRIQNRGIDESILNIFNDSVVTSGAFEITKLNEAHGLPSRVTVSSFADTSSLVDVTSDNTLIFNWDTSILSALASSSPNDWAGVKGVYEVKVRYNILNQLFISSPMFISIR